MSDYKISENVLQGMREQRAELIDQICEAESSIQLEQLTALICAFPDAIEKIPSDQLTLWNMTEEGRQLRTELYAFVDEDGKPRDGNWVELQRKVDAFKPWSSIYPLKESLDKIKEGLEEHWEGKTAELREFIKKLRQLIPESDPVSVPDASGNGGSKLLECWEIRLHKLRETQLPFEESSDLPKFATEYQRWHASVRWISQNRAKISAWHPDWQALMEETQVALEEYKRRLDFAHKVERVIANIEQLAKPDPDQSTQPLLTKKILNRVSLALSDIGHIWETRCVQGYGSEALFKKLAEKLLALWQAVKDRTDRASGDEEAFRNWFFSKIPPSFYFVYMAGETDDIR